MQTLNPSTLLRAAMAGIAALLLSSALADDSGQHKIVNCVAIYLGVMPAEMILGHPKLHTEAKMHGGAPVGEHQRHLLVALFDAASGKRIVGEKVSVRVNELNPTGRRKSSSPCSSRTPTATAIISTFRQTITHTVSGC